jgi:endonuclease/exonuclease/phosphatase family metal-dependent hydrolase
MLLYAKVWRFFAFLSVTTFFCESIRGLSTLNNSTNFIQEVLIQEPKAFLECKEAPVTPDDRRTDLSRLTYGTYNAEFLFLQGYGSLDCPGSDCKWKNQDEAMMHIKQTAANILTLNADILQLVEVEDCQVLNRVVDELTRLGDSSYRPYLVRGEDRNTGQNVALLTRIDPAVDLMRSDERVAIPVDGSTCPRKSRPTTTSKGVTKNLYTYFKVKGFSKPVTVVGAHFLAQPTNTKRCIEREGQASVIASIVDTAVNNDHHVIVSGDFNDWSSTTPDRNNNRPISNVLNILQGSSMEHVGQKVAQADRFSQWYDKNDDCVYDLKEVSTLDHLLVSKSLYGHVESVKYWTSLYKATCSGYNSDHFPITVTLKADK